MPFLTELGCPRDVRFTLDSDQTSDIAGSPFRARSGHVPCSQHSGIVLPRILASASSRPQYSQVIWRLRPRNLQFQPV